MKANFIRHTAMGVAVGIAAAAYLAAAPAAATGYHPPPPDRPMMMPGNYMLQDHPDAALFKDYGWKYPYGLRLDSLDCCYNSDPANPNKESTFSVEQPPPKNKDGANWNSDNDWMLELDWDGGTSATLKGHVRRNNYDDNWDPIHDTGYVDYTITGITEFDHSGNEGWYATGGNGTLTLAGVDYNLVGKQDSSGHAFVFDNHGHRLSDPALVGRGWLNPLCENNQNNPDVTCAMTNDFLFVANKKPGEPPPDGIPEPGTLALFGMGMIGLRYVRRRKNTKA